MPRGSLGEDVGGPKRSRRSRKDAGTREREIVDAAVDIFHEKGYTATSVDDVASAVGILKGSLYYYMDSKEDLLARIVTEVQEEVGEIVDAAVARTDLSPLGRLAEYLRAQVDYNARNIKRVRVYHHDFEQLGSDRLAGVRRGRDAKERAIAGLIGEAKKAGEVAVEVDERMAARAAIGTVAWMYTWYRPGGSVSGKAFGSFCADLVVRGLRAVPAG